MQEDKKYIILENETLEHNGRTLYRIQAIKDFAKVKAGDKGGWVESKNNLSQKGNCWLYREAKAYDNSDISGDVEVFGNAEIYGDAQLWGFANIGWDVKIYDEAKVYGHVMLFDNVEICNNAMVYGYAELTHNIKVCDDACVCEYAYIFNHVEISGDAYVCGNTHIENYAQISGDVCVSCDERIIGDVKINNCDDYLVFRIGKPSHYVTYIKQNKKWITGTFDGTTEEILRREKSYNEKAYNQLKEYIKIMDLL